MGAIEIGDSLPALTLKNEKGEDVDVSTLAAEKGVILFLVPKANTRGLSNSSPHDSSAEVASQLAAPHKPAVSVTAMPTSRALITTCTALAQTPPLLRATGSQRCRTFSHNPLRFDFSLCGTSIHLLRLNSIIANSALSPPIGSETRSHWCTWCD